MQDRYSGDVGDFGKFLLLRSLFSGHQNKLGVVWYLFPNEFHNADGKHINYLNKIKYQTCDPGLCEKLSDVVHGARLVMSLERGGILQTNTIYFSERLDFHKKYSTQRKKDKESRLLNRGAWLKRAIELVEPCNIIFLDPDNGLEIDSCKKLSQMKSGKYAYYSEIKELSKGKDACVVYHHLNRHKKYGTHENQIKARVNELRYKIQPNGKIFALRYRPYSPRAYFIISDKAIEKSLRMKIHQFMCGPCGIFWDEYYEG